MLLPASHWAEIQPILLKLKGSDDTSTQKSDVSVQTLPTFKNECRRYWKKMFLI